MRKGVEIIIEDREMERNNRKIEKKGWKKERGSERKRKEKDEGERERKRKRKE